MRKLVKIGIMLAVATVIQIGAYDLAYQERGYEAIGGEILIFPAVLFWEYKAFYEPLETFDGDEEEEKEWDK